MAKKVEVKFEANAVGFQRGIDSVTRGLDRVQSKANLVKGALGKVLNIWGAIGSRTAGADDIVRQAEASGVNTTDLQLLSKAARIGVEDSGDILATLGEALSLSATEGDPTKTRALIKGGLNLQDISNMSSMDALRRMAGTVRQTGMSEKEMEQLLQDLSLGDQSRYLKQLFRTDFDAGLERVRPLVRSADDLARLSDIHVRHERFNDRVGRFFTEAAGRTFDAYEFLTEKPGQIGQAGTARRQTVDAKAEALRALGTNNNAGPHFFAGDPEGLSNVMMQGRSTEAILTQMLAEQRRGNEYLERGNMVITQE